jgi:hypothetical protein
MRINPQFGAGNPIIESLNAHPDIQVAGYTDGNDVYHDLMPKGDIVAIYCFKDSHIAILDTGAPCILFEGAWKPMYLVEEPQFKEE